MDLGELDAPLLVFGGPYSNLAATRAMRELANRRGIPADRVICTGDTVAYCAEPNETVETIRDWGCLALMGNCEESLGERSSDCGCGFAEGTTCATLADDWYRYADACLTPENRKWMQQLPREIRFQLADRRWLVVHGSPERINQFVFESGGYEEKRRQLDLGRADVVVAGHSGIPFGQPIDNGVWLNAGVIGIPANDGTSDGWYLWLSPEPQGIEASWHRLTYDHAGSRLAMIAAGVSLPYASTLETGLWPSLDMLPDVERTRTGRRLSIPAVQIAKRQGIR